MQLAVATIVIVGLVGVVAGAVGLVRRDRRATTASAALGLGIVVASVSAHGWLLASAFGRVAETPPEAKQQVLARAIEGASLVLPIGMGFAMACVVLSAAGWWRMRHGAGDAG